MRISGWICVALLLAVLMCPVAAAPDYAILTGTMGSTGMAYLVSVDGSSVNQISSLSVGTGLRGVATYEDRAYVADHDGNRLQILKVQQNGSNYSLQSMTSDGLTIGARPNDVAVYGNYAYVANSGEIYMRRVDLSAPLATPTTISAGKSTQCVASYSGGVVVGAASSTGAGQLGRIVGADGGYSQVSTGLPSWEFGAPRQTAVGSIGSLARSYTAVINTYDPNDPNPTVQQGGVLVMDPIAGTVFPDYSFRTENFFPTGVAVIQQGTGQTASWVLAVAGYNSYNDGFLRRYALDADGNIVGSPMQLSLGSGRTHLLALSASGNYLFASSSEGTTPLKVFNVATWSTVGSINMTGFEGWGVAAIALEQPPDIPEPAGVLTLAAGLGGVLSAFRYRRRR